nr:MAG TPA: hypothetical protein [Caudoviricetes sp.]
MMYLLPSLRFLKHMVYRPHLPYCPNCYFVYECNTQTRSLNQGLILLPGGLPGERMNHE